MCMCMCAHVCACVVLCCVVYMCESYIAHIKVCVRVCAWIELLGRGVGVALVKCFPQSSNSGGECGLVW